MKIFDYKTDLVEENVSCIGLFDGVHIGHQKLISETIKLARLKNIKAYAITFDNISFKGKQIITLNDKISLFEKFGLDGVIILNFSELKDLTCDEFIENYLIKMNINTLICGNDFKFGKNGTGNIDTLRDKIKNIIVVEDVLLNNKKVSSTWVKQEIEENNIEMVNKLLGYEYERFILKKM